MQPTGMLSCSLIFFKSSNTPSLPGKTYFSSLFEQFRRCCIIPATDRRQKILGLPFFRFPTILSRIFIKNHKIPGFFKVFQVKWEPCLNLTWQHSLFSKLLNFVHTADIAKNGCSTHLKIVQRGRALRPSTTMTFRLPMIFSST